MVSHPTSEDGSATEETRGGPFEEDLFTETPDLDDDAAGDRLSNTGEEEQGEESDDDESARQGGDGTQDSLDTVPNDITDRAGEIVHKGQLCGVQMSVKTPSGEPLFCGYLSDICRRPKHQAKQRDPTLCVKPGVYSGVLNATKKVVDGITASWTSLEERKRQADANYQELNAAVLTSAQKKLAEE
jgi:hypothetical protein